MKNSMVYERVENLVVRITDIRFDYSLNLFPKWYSDMRGKRLCCHYHLHEDMEIILKEEGCVNFQVNGITYELSENDILIINPFEPHSANIPTECDRAGYYAINLNLNLLKSVPSVQLRGMLDSLTNGNGVYPNILKGEKINEQSRQFLLSLVEGHYDSDELNELSYLFRFFSLLGMPSPINVKRSNKRSAEFIKNTVLYIQNTPPQDISLESISKLLAYNKAYFTTLFKSNFGMSFTDYLNKYKIELAKGLIKNGNYNLNDVATKSGFNYYAYFFKKFKVITGQSPSDFVEQCKNK